MFSVFGTLDLTSGLSRVGIGLRDPRQEVRKGAGVGLMRLCISRARQGDEELEAAVVQMLTDRRMRPDAIAEVARVCMAAGYTSALSALEQVDPGGVHQEIVDSAIDQLETAQRRPVGVWLSDGRDAGEMRAQPAQPASVLVITTESAHQRDVGGAWSSVDLEAAGLRRMFYRRAGTPAAAPAVQGLGHTFHQVGEGDLSAFVDQLVPASEADWPNGVQRSDGAQALVEAIGRDANRPTRTSATSR